MPIGRWRAARQDTLPGRRPLTPERLNTVTQANRDPPVGAALARPRFFVQHADTRAVNKTTKTIEPHPLRTPAWRNFAVSMFSVH